MIEKASRGCADGTESGKVSRMLKTRMEVERSVCFVSFAKRSASGIMRKVREFSNNGRPPAIVGAAHFLFYGSTSQPVSPSRW